MLIIIGIFSWGLNLHGLQKFGINTSCLNLHHLSRIHSSKPGQQWVPIYQLATLFAAWSTFCWILLRFNEQPDSSLESKPHFLPFLPLASLLLWSILPGDFLFQRERLDFFRALRRCTTSNRKTLFSDLILADFLTSYSKVFGDLWSTVWALVNNAHHTSGNLWALERRLTTWILPFAMSLPYTLRFRQCAIDFLDGDRLQFYNAIKYLTALPVICLSFTIPSSKEEVNPLDRVWFGENQLFRLWLLSAMINSLFSCWWDVTMDWGITFRQSTPQSTNLGQSMQNRSHHHHAPLMLRQKLLLSDRPLFYYIIIAINFVLRLTWSIKLSPHFHRTAEREMGVFVLELLEIFRRWIWVYLRVEWESIKTGEAVSQHEEITMEQLPL